MATKSGSTREIFFKELSYYMGEMIYRSSASIKKYGDANTILGYGVKIFSDELDDVFIVTMASDPSSIFEKGDKIDFKNAKYTISAKAKAAGQYLTGEIVDTLEAEEIVSLKDGTIFNGKTGEIKDAITQKATSAFNASPEVKNDQIKK